MAFEVRDYYDFVRLLYQHPEWQEELGNLLIAREIRELPQIVRNLSITVTELAEAQKRSEERLTRLEQVVAELAEAQKRTDEQLRILTQRVDELTQRVDTLTQRVDTLTQRVDTLTQRVDTLTQRVDDLTKRMKELAEGQERLEKRVDKLTRRVGEVSGYMLEGRYRQRPLAYFGRLLAQAQVVDVNEVIPAETNLTEDELQELLVLDVLIRGQLRPSFAQRLGISEVWLAVEVSGQIEYPDVARAWQRAGLLKRCGLWPVVGVVGGQEITDNAKDAASGKKVLVELERQLVNVDEIVTALKMELERGQSGAQ